MKTMKINEKIKKQNINDFNYYGGYNMYAYKFSSDFDIEKKSEKENVLEELKKVDGKYSFSDKSESDGELNYEKMEYTAPTKEKVFESAKNSLEEYKDSSIKKIQDKFESGMSEVEEKESDLNWEKTKDENEIKSDYASYAKDAKNENIKRGLAHSSIYSEVLKEIDQGKESELKKVENEFQREVLKLEGERSLLESQKQSALESFDISYAAKLTEEINKINSDISKKQEEVLKYNNKLQKEAEELKLKKEQAIQEKNNKLAELVSKYGLTEVNKMKYQEKYNIVKDYVEKLPRDQALRELQDPFYEKELGTFYASIVAETYSREK